MLSLGSKLKVVSGVATALADCDWQVPSKVPFCFPELVQLNTLPLAIPFSVKDGPVSEVNLGSVGEDPGCISICRSHCSTLHDWYCFELSAHVVDVPTAAAASLVLMLRVGRAPVAVLFGTQYALSSAMVQLKSRLIDPVARPLDLVHVGQLGIAEVVAKVALYRRKGDDTLVCWSRQRCEPSTWS